MASIREQKIIENGGAYTEYAFRMLCRLFEFRCVKCGNKGVLHADHILPVSMGGCSDIHNIQPLCEDCNFKKGDRETVDYRPTFYKRFKVKNQNYTSDVLRQFVYCIFFEDYGEEYANNIVDRWVINPGGIYGTR